MKINNPLFIKATQIILALALVATFLFIGGRATASDQTANKPRQGTDPSTIQVEFKLDPRLTSGLYMGERWVSPPTYDTVQQGAIFTFEARAQVLGAQGQPEQSAIEWIAADPALVVVIPGQGNQVTINVQGAGETSIQVISQGVSKTLAIKATYQVNAMRVQITQLEENEG